MQQPTTTTTGFLRLPQIIGDKKSEPPIPALLPISRSSFYAGVKEGRYPQPLRLGKRCAVWRAAEIYAYIESVGVQK